MATSDEIKRKALELSEKTDSNSISPKEVGGIMHDLASLGENAIRNGGTLGIRKVYTSVSVMEADKNPKDFWGNPMKKGNLVLIYDGTTTGLDNNKIYVYMNPGWEFATYLDAGYPTRQEFSELGQETGILSTLLKSQPQEITDSESVGYFISNPKGFLADGGGYYFSSKYNVKGKRGVILATATSNTDDICAIGLIKNGNTIYHTANGCLTQPTDIVLLTDELDADTLYVGYKTGSINKNPIFYDAKVAYKADIVPIKNDIARLDLKFSRVENICTFNKSVKTVIIDGDWKKDDVVEVFVSNLTAESGRWYLDDFMSAPIYNILYDEKNGVFSVKLTRDTNKLRIGIISPMGNETIIIGAGLWTNVVDYLLSKKQDVMSEGKNIKLENNKIINTLPIESKDDGSCTFGNNIYVTKGGTRNLERQSVDTRFVSKNGNLNGGGNYYFSSVYDVKGLRGKITATATSNSSAISAIGLVKNDILIYHTANGCDVQPTDSVELTDEINADYLFVSYKESNENESPIFVESPKRVVTIDEVTEEVVTIIAERNEDNYNSIRELMKSITDASPKKQYIIYVPKGEWFECDIQGKKWVKIVGEDMHETILYNDGNADKLTPNDYSIGSKANARLSDVDKNYLHCFYGVDDIDVENLTVRVSRAKYCVHLDREGERKAVFKNCRMINDAECLNTVGIGLWAKQDYTFIGCDFVQNNVGQDCSFYMHNWNNQSYIGKLTIRDCRMNKHFAMFNELGSEASSLIYLINCKSTMSNAKVRLSIESNGCTSYWRDPNTGQPTTDLTKVPYGIKLNHMGTDCGFIINENRPNALDYVIG